MTLCHIRHVHFQLFVHVRAESVQSAILGWISFNEDTESAEVAMSTN
jgi:hypothetical protein